jgi:hypothetical protein
MNAAVSIIIVGWLVLAIGINASDAYLRDDTRVDALIDVGTDVKVIVDDITSKELSLSSVSRPSSQCWMTSIMTIDRLNDSNSPFASGSSYCAAMTEDQLDVLALELTNCELVKARRDMFVVEPHTEDLITSSSGTTACPLRSSEPNQPYDAASCLELLTDHAHSIYHQIRLHTKSLCHHLADEMFQQQREETTQLLALQIQAVLKGTTSTIEQLHFQSALLQNHSHILKEHQTDLQQNYESRKLELQQMYEARKREEAEADRLRKLREEGAVALFQQQSHLMKLQQVDFQNLLKAKEELLDEKVKERMKQLDQMQEVGNTDATVSISHCFYNVFYSIIGR